MRVKFNGQPAFDSNTMWGYTVEVTEEGVFGEVPDDLVDSEAGAGRIVKPTKPVKVEEVSEVQEPKRAGRPPKAQE